MADARREPRNDRPADEPAEEGAVEHAGCLACGGVIAEILLSLGATHCHDCRGGVHV